LKSSKCSSSTKCNTSQQHRSRRIGRPADADDDGDGTSCYFVAVMTVVAVATIGIVCSMLLLPEIIMMS
jgi:hypothetical protein